MTSVAGGASLKWNSNTFHGVNSVTVEVECGVLVTKSGLSGKGL